MVPTPTPICDFGRPAPDFELRGTDGKSYTFGDIAGPKGTLIVFMCNHCPYVQAIRERLVDTAADLADLEIGVAGIMPNDIERYPEDNFENMQKTATEWGLNFPYLLDETQEVARAFGAVCTPDFFGYNAARELEYRGRLDAARKGPPAPETPNELLAAMRRIAETGHGPEEQTPSMGCSIKWRE